MQIAELPSDEELRLLDLASYRILDTPVEQEFEELVELAGQLFGFPISLITLLDKDRQWFKAKRGVSEDGTGRDVAFCAHTILQDGVMIVEDTTKDERFSGNPFVTGERHIRFYAGAPIISPTGYKLGAICVIDDKPNSISPEQERALNILSNQVTRLLELRFRNQVFEQRAKELIDMKNKALQQVLKEQDEEKQHIATELHENMAQVLAAGRLYLGMAEENEEMRLPFIRKANQELGELLSGLRGLSNAISPSTLRSMPLDLLLVDVIDQLSAHYPFSINISIDAPNADTCFDHSITCVRVVEKWIQLLQKKANVTTVNVSLQIKDKIRLVIEDDGAARSFSEIEQEVVTGLIYGRVRALGGHIAFSAGTDKSNRLCIELPLAS